MKQRNLLLVKTKTKHDVCYGQMKHIRRWLGIVLAVCLVFVCAIYAVNHVAQDGDSNLFLTEANTDMGTVPTGENAAGDAPTNGEGLPGGETPAVLDDSTNQEDVDSQEVTEPQDTEPQEPTSEEPVSGDSGEGSEGTVTEDETTTDNEAGTENNPVAEEDAIQEGETGTEDTPAVDDGTTAEDETGTEDTPTVEDETTQGGENIPEEETGTEDTPTVEDETTQEGESGTTNTPAVEDETTQEGENAPEGETGTEDAPTTEDETTQEGEDTPEDEGETEDAPTVEDEITDKKDAEEEEILAKEAETQLLKEQEEEEEKGFLASLMSMFALERATGNVLANGTNLSTLNSGGTYILNSDITVSGQCSLSSNTVLDIDLNGYTMTVSGNQAFMLNGGSPVLNIRDTSEAGTGKIIAKGQLVYGCNGGTFNLYSGTIDGSQASKAQMGGCVWLGASMQTDNVFNMYGGTITGFQATQGGAVYVSYPMSGYSYFYMYGGTIENCYATEGAAVYTSSSGGKPGYFYMKGGKSADGEPKATINCVTYNGQTVPNAIHNYGYLGMEGVVDIDGIVFLQQNNWADTNNRFIRITGRLVVVGDGYIDVNTEYPNSNAICPGHTVVQNSTRTEDSDPSNDISPEEFYTYGSYFINTTKGLLISAGFDPNVEGQSPHPSNWPTYQADKYPTPYEYIDVMGQTMLIQASDSPGDKRTMQNYDYLIYTDRADKSEDYAEFYSIKISKRDIETNSPLDGAHFTVMKKIVAEDGSFTYEEIGSSGTTGDYGDGVGSGETYIYLGENHDGKLMIDDGTYVLVEDTAPEGYIARGELATIEIRHEMDESTGELVSVVKVIANDKVLSTTEQIINSTYGDKGYLVEHEVVLYLNNSQEEVFEHIDYKLDIYKYQDITYETPIAGAEFALNTLGDTTNVVTSGTTDANGYLKFMDANGSVFTFTGGDQYELHETKAPEDHYLMDDMILISVVSDEEENRDILHVDGVPINEGQTIIMGSTASAIAEHGSWKATLSGNLLTICVYDEPMPPTWNIKARKYGTQITEPLAMAGAEFTLFKLNADVGIDAVIMSGIISSDGTNGFEKGTLTYTDAEGNVQDFSTIELECGAEYLLRETFAPMGYEKMPDIRFQVSEDCSSVTVTQNGETYSGASYDSENKILTLSILNKAVYHLPQTGGSGIYPLVAVGIVMMCISVIALMLLSQKRGDTG